MVTGTESSESHVTQTLIKVFGSVAGIALAFYLIGFTVVESYLYGNNLEGFFVVSREFYEGAGAQFLLELVRAPLWSPVVVGAYLVGLLLLIPRPVQGRQCTTTEYAAIGALIVISVLTYAYCLFYSFFLDQNWFVSLVDRLVWDPSHNDDPAAKHAFGFFALATPIVIAGATLLWNFRRHALAWSKTGGLYKATAFGYLAFIAMLPIAFGFHLYDWRVVQVTHPTDEDILVLTTAQNSQDVRIWLIGEFGGRYVFVQRNELDTVALIVARDKDEIERLAFDTDQILGLKVAIGIQPDEVQPAPDIDHLGILLTDTDRRSQ